jgi:type IV pilus assembly protein PilN
MYTLEINFLSDRKTEVTTTTGGGGGLADSQFLLYGAAAAIAAVAVAGGYFAFLFLQREGLDTRLTDLSNQESGLRTQLESLIKQEDQVKAVEAKTNQLVNLFTKTLPTYAFLEDFSKRTPDTIQITGLTQASAAAAGTSDIIVRFEGKSAGFEELNDYLLLLKSSPYLDPNRIVLKSAVAAIVPERNITLVTFQIEANLTTKSAADLFKELEASGADGLIERVRLLQQEKIITLGNPGANATPPTGAQPK